MEEVLARLRPEWALFRDEDYGWRIEERSEGFEGDYLSLLAIESTIAEAIAAAEVKVAENERRDAEQRADYERRRIAGKLTPMERIGEWIPPVWDTVFTDAVEGNSVLARRINREYENWAKDPNTR